MLRIPAIASLLITTAASAQPFPARSGAERLAPERLAAVHAEVQKLAAQRRDLPDLPGLHDHRAIFHAHAGDSSHTGGTREELLTDAHRAGVSIVFLSDHYRPPRDFMRSWRGLHEGVLFVPGSETHGLLIHPQASVLDVLESAPDALRHAVAVDGGLSFLSHVEERVDSTLEDLTGMEIYNRHADVADDQASLLRLVAWMTDPEGVATLRSLVQHYPAEILASQVHYPSLYLDKWDLETRSRRVVGVAANDCHHNQVFVVLRDGPDAVRLGTVVDDFDDMRRFTAQQRPRIPELTAGKSDGQEIARFDFDPYFLSMHNVSTHVLSAQLEEASVRDAVAAGHVYVAHDWMSDPTGFRFSAKSPEGELLLMGDETSALPVKLSAALPLPARLRLLRGGTEVWKGTGRTFEFTAREPGAYRLEAWLELDGEVRPWIYSNPIYLRAKDSILR
jgi:hypothetical protein